MRLAMTLENIIKGNGMKVHVTTLRRFGDSDFEEEKYESFYRDEIACLYRDRKGVFLLRKNGILVKVKHSLKEMEGYFLGSVYPIERASNLLRE